MCVDVLEFRVVFSFITTTVCAWFDFRYWYWYSKQKFFNGLCFFYYFYAAWFWYCYKIKCHVVCLHLPLED